MMFKKIFNFFKNINNKKSQKNYKNITKKHKNSKQEHTSKIRATIDHVSFSHAYAIVEDNSKFKSDIKIFSKNLNGSFHEDKVEIVVNKRGFGIVTRILSRARDTFVGRVQKITSDRYIVKLDGKKMHHDIILISKKRQIKVYDGDKVIIKIKAWPKNHALAEAITLENLGKSGEHTAEMSSILFEFGLSQNFPKEVVEECKKIPLTISEKEKHRRRDFTKVLTFTIDPENAKDFDDAISIQYLDNGNYQIGVHVADPSYYVENNTYLDKEACRRGNSTYLVDRTVPMLPEILSNQLCSLRPNEEKLAVSAVFEIDANANILNCWLGETIIYSQKRFIYEEAQQNIDLQSGEYYKELTLLNNIAKKLREKRFKNGSIHFSSSEFHIRLDEQGNPINVYKKQEIDTNRLIEEFMLLANKEIAKKIYSGEFSKHKTSKNPPSIYRIHEKPNREKLVELSRFLQALGYKFNVESKNLPAIFNALAEDFRDRSEFSIVQYFAIRSMAKAIYSTRCIGHFGLGFEYYTHFTSPIRRYADLEVHRILKRCLNKKKSLKKDYKKICEHISATERNSIDAERASIKYKQVLYLQSLKGRVEEGMISYISEKSLFVELLNSGCEGTILFASIDGDYYELDSKTFSAVGRTSKKRFKIGDNIKVKIKECDLDKRQAYFDLYTKGI